MVLDRLKISNLQFDREKSKFGVPELSFLGHRVDAAGVHTTRNKVRAIVGAPPPTSKQSLQAFVALLAFYDQFLEQ